MKYRAGVNLSSAFSKTRRVVWTRRRSVVLNQNPGEATRQRTRRPIGLLIPEFVHGAVVITNGKHMATWIVCSLGHCEAVGSSAREIDSVARFHVHDDRFWKFLLRASYLLV